MYFFLLYFDNLRVKFIKYTIMYSIILQKSPHWKLCFVQHWLNADMADMAELKWSFWTAVEDDQVISKQKKRRMYNTKFNYFSI